jgi:ATP-dependent protease ClpP protease subunit
MGSSTATSTSRPPSAEEKKKFLAEAQAAESQATLFEAETRVQVAEAEQQEIVLRAKQRVEKDELAKNAHNHVYVFDQPVGESSVKACIDQLTAWTRQTPGCAIEIQINSPGGDVVEGFALIDFLSDLRQKGHEIDIVTLGMAASMAGVILQAADNRIMGKNSILLIHEASFGAVGSYGEVEDRIKLVDIFHERILSIFAERAQPINNKTTKAFIKRNWNRKDWWLSADSALKLGFVDQVR